MAALTKFDEWKRFLANTRPLAVGLIPAISAANYDTSPIFFRYQRSSAVNQPVLFLGSESPKAALIGEPVAMKPRARAEPWDRMHSPQATRVSIQGDRCILQ